MKLRGFGVGAMMYGLGYGFSRPDFASAEVEMASDGSVTVWNGASELGQGLRTALCQIAAQELGISYSQTVIISADTGSTPDSGPVSASRSVYVQGKAVIQACDDLKTQFKIMASELLNTGIENINFYNGSFIDNNNPSKETRITDVAAECHKLGKRFRGYGWINNTTSDVDPADSQGDAYSAYCWASQLVEVEIDLDTGKTKCVRIVSATDAGKAINPQIVEGQVEGGAMQGLGFVLMEDMILEEGVFKNANLSTYLIPTASDVPIVESIIVEVPDPTGPYGAKGVGEPATIPTAPAILNAIARIIGVRIKQTPATAEKILIALGKIPPTGRNDLPKLDEIPYPPL